MKKLRIALTGATGLIGRNLLFEIIKQNINDLENIEILSLGRDLKGMKYRDRIFEILRDDGLDYIDADSDKSLEILENFDHIVKCVHMDLEREGLALQSQGFKLLVQKPIDIFYHVGASTDLSLGRVAENRLREINVNGTLRILKLISQLKIGQFCYVGTAYSCGNVSGKVMPDFINLDQKFRNPYEKTKLEAEIMVREYAKENKIRCRYFRPSVTCGRLIEKPLGAMSKFDVFYGWAGFFLKLKQKHVPEPSELYTKRVNMDVRVCFNKRSGLNIVPADYAAKVMYQVCIQDDPGESYHVVNPEETPHDFYISQILSFFNISKVVYVDSIPRSLNQEEKLYYKTAGKVFTPYISSDSMIFSTRNLSKVLSQGGGGTCPSINPRNFSILLEYAKKYDFGIRNSTNG